MHTIFLNLKQLYSLVPFTAITVLNYYVLTLSGLYVAQASYPFKCLNPCQVSTIFIAKVFCLTTYANHFKLLLKWIDNLYSATLYLLGWFSWRVSIAKAMPTNNTDYS